MAIQNDEQYGKVVDALKAGKFDDKPALKKQLAVEASRYRTERATAETEARIERFTSNIASSPMEAGVPETIGGRGNSFLPGGVTPGREGAPSNPQLLNQAAKAGVDIRTGAPARIRGMSGLLKLDPGAQLAAADSLLREQYKEAGVELPEEIPAVFKEEHTGQLAYWQPTEEGWRPTLMNGLGADAGDVIRGLDEAAGIAIEAGSAVGGALGGGALGSAAGPGGATAGAIAGGATAAGAASFAVNKARQEAARLFGIPDEIVDRIETSDQLSEALTAAGFELAGPAVNGIIRMWRNAGRVITNADDAADLISRLEKVKGASDRIYESTGQRIIPQAGGSPEFNIIRANVARDAQNRRSTDLRAEEVRNNMHIADAMESIVRGDTRAMPDIAVANAGESARRVVIDPVEQAQRRAARSQEDLNSLVDNAAEGWRMRPYVNVQRESEGVLQTMRNQNDENWGTFREAIGFDETTSQSKIMLDNRGQTPITQALSNLSQRANTALSEGIANSRRRLAEDMGWKIDPETGLVDPQRLSGQRLDMHELHQLSSELKAQIRKAEASNAPDFPTTELRKIVGAIDQQLAEGSLVMRNWNRVGAERSAIVRDSYLAARNTHRMVVDAENLEAVSRILETRRLKDGTEVWARSPKAVRDVLFNQNPDSLAQVLDHVDGNPGLRAMIGKEMDALYKERVMSDGQWKQGAHDRFVAEYKNHMDLVFGSENSDLVRNAADMGREVKRLQARAKGVEEAYREVYGRKLAGTDAYPGNIANDIFSGSVTPAQTRALVNKLGKRSPETLDAVRAQGQQWLHGQLMQNAGTKTNSNAVAALMGDSQKREAIRALYGEQMVKDMDDMALILREMEGARMGRASKVVVNTPMMVAFRSIFGPLSPIQRRLTAAQRLRGGLRQYMMMELVSDPTKVRNFVRLSRTSPRSVAAIQGFTALGIPVSQWPEETQELLERTQQWENNSPRNQVMRQLDRVNRERGRNPY